MLTPGLKSGDDPAGLVTAVRSASRHSGAWKIVGQVFGPRQCGRHQVPFGMYYRVKEVALRFHPADLFQVGAYELSIRPGMAIPLRNVIQR
jgi:hypothetical protein